MSGNFGGRSRDRGRPRGGYGGGGGRGRGGGSSGERVTRGRGGSSSSGRGGGGRDSSSGGREANKTVVLNPAAMGRGKDAVNMPDPEVIKMDTGEAPIYLTNRTPVIYNDCGYYDMTMAEKANTWHFVVVHHGKKFLPDQIQDALYEQVGDAEFFIVGYRLQGNVDYFLTYPNRAAISRLFRGGLKLTMPNGKRIFLTVKFNVAEYKEGQIDVVTKFRETISIMHKQPVKIGTTGNCLNLESFADHPNMKELKFRFNKAIFIVLIIQLRKLNILSSVSGLKLSKNKLKTLSGLDSLQLTILHVIDLRFNEIEDLNELKFLRQLTFAEIYLEGNPITKHVNYLKTLLEMFPKLITVDGKKIRDPEPKPHDIINLVDGEREIVIQFNGDTINPKDTADPNIMRKYKSSFMWHQAIVNHKNRFAKPEILQSLRLLMPNTEFYPCHYKCGNNADTFFVRNSCDGLDILFKNRLELLMSNGTKISITLKMNVSKYERGQVEPTDEIQKEIAQRFNLTDKTLNLESFDSSARLKNVEISLSNPPTLANVLLQSARRYLTNIQLLKLNNNGIESAKGMHSLTWMKCLKSIDFRKNAIDCISDMDSMPMLNVSEVYLSDNPMCRKFSAPNEYVSAIKKLFPELKVLDGESLTTEGIGVTQQNFICSLEGYDLVDQFVQQYFTTFDNVSRSVLKALYHPKAILTISTDFSRNQADDEVLKYYTTRTRNILRLSDYDDLYKTFIYGQTEIISHWKDTGSTEHDFYSFKVDLTQYTETMATITVNGLFKDTGHRLNDDETIIGFVRTFVLKLVQRGLGMFGKGSQYQIINEMVVYYRPSIALTISAFKTPRAVDDGDEITDLDKQGLIIIFQELTDLVSDWSRRCLEQSSWNFRNALEIFMQLQGENKIPNKAYLTLGKSDGNRFANDII